MPGMRASHEDRDRVVDALRVAGGDGRLSAEELDTRLERALSARTLGELAGLTADLPNAPVAREVLVIRQHAGKYVQEGRWLVPARIELGGPALVAPGTPSRDQPGTTLRPLSQSDQ